MTTLDAPSLVADEMASAAWKHSPFGMAVIGIDGMVHAANPELEAILDRPLVRLLGMGEADFVDLVSTGNVEHRRVELAQKGMRSIHYIRRASAGSAEVVRLARIAEELREPLASIYGFAELLVHQNYDEETRRELTITMLGDIEVMIDLINRQLDLTDSAQ